MEPANLDYRLIMGANDLALNLNRTVNGSHIFQFDLIGSVLWDNYYLNHNNILLYVLLLR